jgi:hypothetical protein
MKSEKRRWRPSPLIVVLTTAAIVIVVTMVLGWLNARRYRTTASVEIGEPAVAIEASLPPASVVTSILPDDEVARMAMRIRETTGLLMGLTILAISEQISNRNPGNVEALVNLMSQRNLLPPGIDRVSGGALASDHATIYVRYCSRPIGVEVVSVGREKLDGPAVIARLYAGGDDDAGAVLLIAKRFEGIAIPRAFAPLTEIATFDWSIEQLRERSFAERELNRINEWARGYGAPGK